MIKIVAATLMLMGVLTLSAMASDVNCCMVCCKGSTCIMTHGRPHDCGPVGAHPPCK